MFVSNIYNCLLVIITLYVKIVILAIVLTQLYGFINKFYGQSKIMSGRMIMGMKTWVIGSGKLLKMLVDNTHNKANTLKQGINFKAT